MQCEVASRLATLRISRTRLATHMHHKVARRMATGTSYHTVASRLATVTHRKVAMRVATSTYAVASRLATRWANDLGSEYTI